MRFYNSSKKKTLWKDIKKEHRKHTRYNLQKELETFLKSLIQYNEYDIMLLTRGRTHEKIKKSEEQKEYGK